eukprot:jgi/Botrbrau1/9107/Bobra.0305s0014.3
MWGQATANVLNICPPLRPGCNYCRPSTLKGSYSKGRVDVARLVTRVVINSPWAFEPWLLSGCVSGDLSSSYDGSHFRNVMNRTQQLSTRHPPPRRLRHLFPRAIQSTIERVEASNGKGTPDGKGKGKRRRLIMMRHAESEERPIDARDHDRPITDLGKRTAQEIAKELQDKGWLPELIVCSNATRTRQTLSAMCEVVSALKTARTQFRGSLYSVAALDGHTRHHLQVAPALLRFVAFSPFVSDCQSLSLRDLSRHPLLLCPCGFAPLASEAFLLCIRLLFLYL